MYACNHYSEKVSELTLSKAVGGNAACEHRTKLIIFLGTPDQQNSHRECILEKNPDPWAHTRNMEVQIGHIDWRFKAAVSKSGIRVYSFQEAQGTSGSVLRSEVGRSASSGFARCLLTAL
jgi:hypothetical protein